MLSPQLSGDHPSVQQCRTPARNTLCQNLRLGSELPSRAAFRSTSAAHLVASHDCVILPLQNPECASNTKIQRFGGIRRSSTEVFRLEKDSEPEGAQTPNLSENFENGVRQNVAKKNLEVFMSANGSTCSTKISASILPAVCEALGTEPLRVQATHPFAAMMFWVSPVHYAITQCLAQENLKQKT